MQLSTRIVFSYLIFMRIGVHPAGMDQLHSSVIVLIIELGEVFRRSIWAIYRIEWEVIVQQERAIEKDPALAEKLRVKYPGYATANKAAGSSTGSAAVLIEATGTATHAQ